MSAKSVVEKFRAGGYEPEGYTLGSYAAVQAWAAAAEIAGTTEAAKVAAALHGGTIPTVIGDLSWDAKGDLTHVSYAWYVWDDGRAIRGALNRPDWGPKWARAATSGPHLFDDRLWLAGRGTGYIVCRLAQTGTPEMPKETIAIASDHAGFELKVPVEAGTGGDGL